MINHLYTQSCLLLVSLFLLSSCQKENLTYKQEDMEEIQPGTDPVVPGQDQFIVSYALGEGESSRAAETGKRPIRSLHYYVYDANTNRLYKKRQIRGIDENTIWPISDRSKMSWELRQDLQDTLSDHSKYRILFIANADPKLFKKVTGEGGEVNQQLIINDEDYNTARLILPKEGFKEDNMYFLWEGILDRTITPLDKVVKRNDIMLRRVVTKSVFQRDLDGDVHTEDDEQKNIEKIIEDYYKDHCEPIVRSVVNAQITAFTNRITKQITTFYKSYVPDFNAFLLKEQTQIDSLIKSVIKQEFRNFFSTHYSQNTSWKHKAELARMVKIDYEPNTQATSISFSRVLYHNPDYVPQNSYSVDVDGKFSIVGFGGTGKDVIRKLDFFDDNKLAFSVSGTPFSNNNEMNRLYNVICNPMSTFVVVTYTRDMTFDMDNLYSGQFIRDGLTWNQLMDTKEEYKSVFKKYIENWVFHEKGEHTKEVGFGSGFNAFKLSFSGDQTLPDLTKKENLSLIPTWTIQ